MESQSKSSWMSSAASMRLTWKCPGGSACCCWLSWLWWPVREIKEVRLRTDGCCYTGQDISILLLWHRSVNNMKFIGHVRKNSTWQRHVILLTSNQRLVILQCYKLAYMIMKLRLLDEFLNGFSTIPTQTLIYHYFNINAHQPVTCISLLVLLWVKNDLKTSAKRTAPLGDTLFLLLLFWVSDQFHVCENTN